MRAIWKRFEGPGWSGVDLSNPKDRAIVDPYLAWAESTRFSDLGGPPSRWVPVTLELHEPANVFAEWAAARASSWLRIPEVYRSPPEQLAGTTFCTARVRRRFFRELVHSLRNKVAAFELGLAVVSAADRSAPVVEPPTPRSGALAHLRQSRPTRAPKVVVGVIDDGLAFAHERFRERDGRSTRIEHFWNQDEPHAGSPAHGSRPSGFGYGWELTKDAIDRLLSGAASEAAIYQAAGNRRVRRAYTHGTHVMDLACGEPWPRGDPGTRLAAAPRIVGVQLPERTTLDTSRCSLALHVLDGIRFILDRAEAMSARNVVINLSYAPFAGPHDGSSILEKAMDELIAAWTARAPGSGRAGAPPRRLAIVLPAGNGRLARCHSRLTLRPGEAKTLRLRIHPDDETPSFLEIWLPARAASSRVSSLAVEVTAPSGLRSGEIAAGSVATLLGGDTALCTVVHLGPASRTAAGAVRDMILVGTAPSARADHGASPVAPAGVWQVRLRNASRTALDIYAMIQRDDSAEGDPVRGRQAHFEDPDYEFVDALDRDRAGRRVEGDRAASYTKRAGTISGIATGRQTIVIGGLRRKDGAVAAYSGEGTTSIEPGDRLLAHGAPDAATVSDRSVTRVGVIGGGSRSGSRVPASGTSVAAPLVARWIAEQMAGDRPADRRAVIEFAKREDAPAVHPPSSRNSGETRTAAGGENRFDARRGAGRIAGLLPEDRG